MGRGCGVPGRRGSGRGSDARGIDKPDPGGKDSELRGAGRSAPWAGQVVTWMKRTPEGLGTAGREGLEGARAFQYKHGQGWNAQGL